MRFAWLRYAFAAVGLAGVVLALYLVRRRTATTRPPFAYPLAVLGFVPWFYEAALELAGTGEPLVRFRLPLALAVVAFASTFVVLRRLPPRVSAVRGRLTIATVWTATTLTALVLARPELGRTRDRVAIVVAVDRSRSMDLTPDLERRVTTELRLASQSMHPDDRIAVVDFGADAVLSAPFRRRDEAALAQSTSVGRDGTDLENAIRRALSELPTDASPRIVLLSDGVETRGDAMAGASSALASAVPVDTVLFEQRPGSSVRIAQVRGPGRVDEHEPIDLRIVTGSTRPANVELRVKRDGEPYRVERTRIGAGEDIVRLRDVADGPGLHRYDVDITALDPGADVTPEDNTGAAFVQVRGKALALLLDGEPGKGAPVAAALATTGFTVDRRGLSQVPADVAGFAGYDLVVLTETRASDLSATQLAALASYTQDIGGGLLLMGSDRSFGPGGYGKTPVEDVSPVSFEIKREKRRASLSEIIVIDYSGSMGAMVSGQTKLALANEAAARSASLLGPGDRLGVAHVDTVVKWTVPLSPVTDAADLGRKIRAVDVGGGGIYTHLGLVAAYQSIGPEASNLKHVLLFADGDDAEELAGCRALVQDARNRGITTSVISLGRGHDSAELEVLSKVGSGRFYLIDDAGRLPAVFAQETILASKASIREEAFRVAAGAPSPFLRGIDPSRAPPLGGYVVTAPKPRAEVALTGPDGDPILASWSVGLGRSAAFTSDYEDRWGREWLAWPAAQKLFGQVARDTARKAADPRVRLDAETTGGMLQVHADVVGDDGRAQSFRRLSVHIAGPDGYAKDLPLEVQSVGRYATRLPLSRPGTYVATLRDDTSREVLGTAGASLSLGDELRPTGSDAAALSRISHVTSGKTRATLAGLFDDRGDQRLAYGPLGNVLLVAAAALFFAGIAARRFGMPEALTNLGPKLRAHLAWRRSRNAVMATTAPSAAPAAMDLLKRRQERSEAAPPPAAPLAGARVPPTPRPAPAPMSPAPKPPVDAPAPAAPPPSPAASTSPGVSLAERLAQKKRDRGDDRS